MFQANLECVSLVKECSQIFDLENKFNAEPAIYQ